MRCSKPRNARGLVFGQIQQTALSLALARLRRVPSLARPNRRRISHEGGFGRLRSKFPAHGAAKLSCTSCHLVT